MTALFFLISVLSALIYFGIIKRLNEKWLEIVHFSALYLILVFVFLIVFCFVQKMNADPQYWDFKQCVRDAITVSALFFILPGFVVSYLLYPFKIIKRSKVLIWILSIVSILITGIATLFEIAHAFSNM
ncbi:MAG: hypothetical protein LBS55_05785 [Prevotellaceae bacterium]|jgi:hypothetical protein|nr:hypothetical protein [Prevotellaceae bacterium]